MVITKGLALTGYRILTDTAFFDKVMKIHSKFEGTLFELHLRCIQVKASFEQSKAARP